jgi:hypothetical protein
LHKNGLLASKLAVENLSSRTFPFSKSSPLPPFIVHNSSAKNGIDATTVAADDLLLFAVLHFIHFNNIGDCCWKCRGGDMRIDHRCGNGDGACDSIVFG